MIVQMSYHRNQFLNEYILSHSWRTKIGFVSLLSLLVSIASSPSFAASRFVNTTIEALLSENAALQVVYSNGERITITFRRDGHYEASNGAKGQWVSRGDVICFLRDETSDFDGKGGRNNCGRLSVGKALRDNWVAPAARGGDVTLSIIKIELQVERK
jgi:hypothetical protein